MEKKRGRKLSTQREKKEKSNEKVKKAYETYGTLSNEPQYTL
jgi:hypothetical protein